MASAGTARADRQRGSDWTGSAGDAAVAVAVAVAAAAGGGAVEGRVTERAGADAVAAGSAVTDRATGSLKAKEAPLPLLSGKAASAGRSAPPDAGRRCGASIWNTQKGRDGEVAAGQYECNAAGGCSQS